MENQENILISYYGPFTIKMVSTLGKYLTENLDLPVNLRMKLYRVCIEIADNVSRYSARREKFPDLSTVGVGKIVVINEEKCVKFTTVNEIFDEHEEKLIKNCTEINGSSGDKIKLRRMALRRESLFQDASAHIGLLTIRLHSENPIEFEIISDSERRVKYFSITTTINKI